MNSSPLPIERSRASRGRRIDFRELARAVLMAGVVATVVTGLAIESEYLDHPPTPAPAATSTVVPREPVSTDAPLRGMSPSEIWAADESAHGLRPEAAH